VTRSLGALLISVAIGAAAPLAYAQHGGGGGGGGHAGGGGGGHFSGGGGFSGGGHSFGGGHAFGGAHVGGYAGHAYGYGGGHAFAAPHYGFSGHSYGGYAGHYVAPTGHGFAYTANHVAHTGYVSRPGTVAPHPGVGTPSAGYYWHGGGHPWAGGYWHGGYWPHCWYYPGWAWYLPVLPVGYVTYWWGGMPYYYWNSLYYTWNPADNGYVVTDPPPAAEGEGSADTNGAYEQAPQSSYAGTAGDVYVYPRNGQTEEQTQNDRYECHSWAVSQSGFDPTRPEQTGNPADYRRAMVACLDARGYSAR